jgi:GTP-binding protein
MFLDEKELPIRAGKGGDGSVLFRREIYVPRGGPDGGDGGRGGDVFIKGRTNLHALTHLGRVDRVFAEDGALGGHKTSTGKSGASETILVPLGTEVQVKNEKKEWALRYEVLEEGQRYRLAKGGNGGWGNWHFRSSVQQAPDHANPGQAGEAMDVRFVLKLIADVGLIGLPNAGKSTLLSVVSAAKPKIADYPFTTLEPQLGVALVGEQQLVIADLPGLIEGASEGKGLGAEFLRHVERTRILVHCLDATPDLELIEANYRTVRRELTGWSAELAAKKEIITLTKADATSAGEAKRQALELRLERPVRLVSAASHHGIPELLTDCLQTSIK